MFFPAEAALALERGLSSSDPQTGTSDVEIKVPSTDNPALLKVPSFQPGVGRKTRVFRLGTKLPPFQCLPSRHRGEGRERGRDVDGHVTTTCPCGDSSETIAQSEITYFLGSHM